MTPNFETKKNYEHIVFHWESSEGEFIGYDWDFSEGEGIRNRKEVKEQYNIFYEDGSATDLRLYVSSDSLWIVSYVPIASTIVIGSSGSEMIMSIYKLSK